MLKNFGSVVLTIGLMITAVFQIVAGSSSILVNGGLSSSHNSINVLAGGM